MTLAGTLRFALVALALQFAAQGLRANEPAIGDGAGHLAPGAEGLALPLHSLARRAEADAAWNLPLIWIEEQPAPLAWDGLHEPGAAGLPPGAVVEAPAEEAWIIESEEGEWTDAPPGARIFSRARRWFASTPFFGNGISDVRDPRRHFGVGVPLEGTSWRNRPWHVGALVGFVDGGEVLDHAVLQDSAALWGLRLGHDFDHYWGWELRVAFAQMDLSDASTGAPLGQRGRSAYYDFSLLYYPLGDTRWRPYFLAGIGASTQGFADLTGRAYDETSAGLPLGLGIKYFVRPGVSLRGEFTNNLFLGTKNAPFSDNVSLTLGFDVHFGGRRRVYFPWQAGTRLW